MYRPASFREDGRERLMEFAGQYSFATVVTAHQDDMIASHVPVLVARGGGELLLHLARGNPQTDHLRAGVEALCIFQGPHCYVSPSWYATAPAVPTWNYAAVHIYGKARTVEGEGLMRLLGALVERYETGRERPWRFDEGLEWNRRMAQGIEGFAIAIERIEGKFKMSQNRSEEDRRGVIAALEASGDAMDREVARWVRDTLGSQPTGE